MDKLINYNTMIKYVCGFHFDKQLQNVVLIWKEKPAWQKGKLNGVGGKIEEAELPLNAMIREFKEETGLHVDNWGPLVNISGADWFVHFFYSVDESDRFEYAESQETEEVAKINVDSLLAWDFQHIRNLDWLIPLALNKIQHPDEIISFG